MNSQKFRHIVVKSGFLPTSSTVVKTKQALIAILGWIVEQNDLRFDTSRALIVTSPSRVGGTVLSSPKR
jgi:hypothetical protein